MPTVTTNIGLYLFGHGVFPRIESHASVAKIVPLRKNLPHHTAGFFSVLRFSKSYRIRVSLIKDTESGVIRISCSNTSV